MKGERWRTFVLLLPELGGPSVYHTLCWGLLKFTHLVLLTAALKSQVRARAHGGANGVHFRLLSWLGGVCEPLVTKGRETSR